MKPNISRLLAVLIGLATLHAAPLLAAGSKGQANPSYVTMTPLTVTLFDQGGATGMVFVKVNLQVPNMAKKPQVTEALPRLRDQYLEIMSQLASTTYSVDRPIDVAFLTSVFQRVTDRMLGKGIARVEIGDATTQPL